MIYVQCLVLVMNDQFDKGSIWCMMVGQIKMHSLIQKGHNAFTIMILA